MTIQQKLTWVPALLLAAAATPCAAQRPADYKKSGDFYYTSGNYYSAAVYYQQYLDGGKGSSTGGFHPYAISLAGAKKAGSGAATGEGEIQYRLAESYRRIYNFSKAAEAYERLLKGKDAAAYPEARYGYALALRAQGKDAEAKTQLEQYLQAGGRNSAAAQLELQSIAFAQNEKANPAARAYNVARLADPINGAETNYAAQWSNGSLLFTSTRPDSAHAAKDGNVYANRIYTGTPGGAVQPLAIANTDGSEQGTATMSPDGSSLYFSRWSYDRGTPVSSIFMSRKSGDSWSEPVRLSEAVNVSGASARQPFVTPDGQYLLFSSDRPGGLGGYDIWAAPINGGNFGAAVNLGASVNSAADDEAPFYHAPSQTLVFASRGRVGLGGLDLYSAKGTVAGGFAGAQNMGYPVNSNRDDSYFSTASPDRLLKGAVISSDRGQDACMSLYSVDKQYRQFVAGKVLDCETQQPLAGARVQLDGRSAATASDGSYTIEVAAYASTNVSASLEGYEAGQASLAKPAGDVDTLQSPVVCLKALPKDTAAVAEPPARDNTVLFDFAKWSLRPETQVTLDTLAAVLKREGSLRAIITGYTDQVGSDDYNLKLSRERAQACADYLKRQGIPASRIEVLAKGACCPLQPEKTADGQDDPAARQKNRRVEFDIKLTR
ncbi:OmpA family protein [Flaviaesturariibacter terrae]